MTFTGYDKHFNWQKGQSVWTADDSDIGLSKQIFKLKPGYRRISSGVTHAPSCWEVDWLVKHVNCVSQFQVLSLWQLFFKIRGTDRAISFSPVTYTGPMLYADAIPLFLPWKDEHLSWTLVKDTIRDLHVNSWDTSHHQMCSSSMFPANPASCFLTSDATDMRLVFVKFQNPKDCREIRYEYSPLSTCKHKLPNHQAAVL